MKIDTLFNNQTEKKAFTFDKDVAEVFDNMALRSIPGYRSQQLFISEIVCSELMRRHNMPTLILDLGCSTGETFKSINTYIEDKESAPSTHNATLYGTDYSKDMLELARQKLAAYTQRWRNIILTHLDLKHTDIFWQELKKEFGVAHIIILHFVLQFIPLSQRDIVLEDVWNYVDEGGYLLIGEKLKSKEQHVQEFWENVQYNFKKLNGYSDEQIRYKHAALEGVLIPQEVELFKYKLSKLPKAEVRQYYMHGAFQCFVVKKLSR